MENIVQGHWFRGPSSDLGEPINHSLRFRAGTGSSGHLTKSITSSSSTAALTVSFWCKINPHNSGSAFIFSSGTSGGNSGNIYFDGTNENIRFQDTSSYTAFTTQKLRDPSAWYHIVYRFDAANEYVKVYVNGQQHSSTAIATTARTSIGASSPMQVGMYADTSYINNRFDGQLAEFNMLFGTSLGPDSFGRTNAEGIWVPISLSDLTSNQYGALGFRFIFDPSAGLGDDTAPTGGTHASANDFTATGFNTTALKNYDNLVDTTNSGVYSNNEKTEGVHQIFDGTSSTSYNSAGAGTLDLGDLGADLGTGVSTIVVRTYPRLGTNTVTVNSTTATASGNSNHNVTINHDGSAITTFTVAGTDSAYFGVTNITVDGTELVNNTENDIDNNDTPTSNAITLNPVDKSTSTVVDGANLSYSGTSTWHKARCTQPYPSTGTWYYEYHAQSASGWVGAVQGNKPLNNDTIAGQSGYWVLINDGSKSINGTTSTDGGGITAGDIIGVTYNAGTDTMKWYRNNTLVLTETSVTPDTQSNLLFPLISFYGETDSTINYGQYAFAYTPPDSAKACNEFIAEFKPTIKDGKDHFGVLTYSGAGSSANITGLNFQPDLVWIKNRDVNDFHTLYDSVRGAGKRLITNDQDPEFDQSNSLNGFLSNGFSVGGHNSVAGSGEDYVAWCWKAGTSYTPTVTGFTSASASINTKAGFGIYKFTGNNTASSFTHGLDARPQLVIAKTLGTDDWAVFGPTSSSTALAATATFHRFNLNDYVTKSSNVLTAVSDTTLSFGSFAETAGSSDYIYYCWHSVEGYSKVGSYYGTGNATGKFTYCGFKPAWVMIKCITQDGDWNIYDSTRNTSNPNQEIIKGNLTNTEQVYSGEDIDFLANGFKCRGLNANINETYHYMYLAFAEHPFGGEEVPPATAR